MSWPTLIASLIAALLTSGGTVAVINALARRRVTKVEAADRLNESTLEWAEQLKADASEARRDAAEARREAADARREMAVVRHEAEALAKDLHRLRLAIMDPYVTLDGLRAMVGDPGNGAAVAIPR